MENKGEPKLKRIEITAEDMKNEITVIKHNVTGLELDCDSGKFFDDVSNIEVVKFLKGFYTNKERFKSNFIERLKLPFKQILSGNGDIHDQTESPFGQELYNRFAKGLIHINEIEKLYDEVQNFTYREAFGLKNKMFQARVFGTINITEMIKELGNTRIKTEGHPVKHKQFDVDGNFTGYKEYDNIYETHQVNGEKLGINEALYVLKCWCTSTNNEHWLWIEPKYKDSPLDAVAATFRVHENLIPHIKELKRQGDILLVEMDKDVTPEGDEVPLTKEQYFSLLTAES